MELCIIEHRHAVVHVDHKMEVRLTIFLVSVSEHVTIHIHNIIWDVTMSCWRNDRKILNVGVSQNIVPAEGHRP